MVVKNIPNISHWDSEMGYDHEEATTHPGAEYPIRIYNAKQGAGLVVKLFENDLEYLCHGLVVIYRRLIKYIF